MQKKRALSHYLLHETKLFLSISPWYSGEILTFTIIKKRPDQRQWAIRKHWRNYDFCQVNGKWKTLCVWEVIHIEFFHFRQSCRLVFSAFQRNAQPSPQVAISGVWGYATNKHFYCFGNCDETVKIGKLVQVCIACEFCPVFVITSVF